MKLLGTLFLLLLFCAQARLCTAQASPPAGAPPAQVKADLRRILEAPEFQPEQEQEGLLTRFSLWLQARWKALMDWLRKKFDFKMEPPDVHVGSSNGLATLVVPVVTALLLCAVIWIVALLIARNQKGRAPAKAKTTSAFDIDDAAADMVDEPDEWLRQARQYADAGDFRRAFRAVFLGILLQLDRGGAIEYSRSRTNGDYVRLIRARNLHALFEVFRPLVFEFDMRWYGHRPTNEADYRRFREEYDRIRTLLAAPAGRAAAGRA